MWKIIQEEPVLVQAVVQALVAFGVAFGWNLTDTQVATILALSAAILGLLARRQVTPLANPRMSDGTRLVPERAVRT